MHKLLAICLMLAAIIPATARRQSTTRKNLTPADIAPAAHCLDTLALPADTAVVIAGFDKPLRSRQESFIVVNHLPDTISGMNISLNYTDVASRQLHNREHTLNITVPPGESRMAHIPAWDRQMSYYYIRSRRPPRATATAFSVQARVLWVTVPCRK